VPLSVGGGELRGAAQLEYPLDYALGSENRGAFTSSIEDETTV